MSGIAGIRFLDGRDAERADLGPAEGWITDGELSIAADARIDNRDELIATLGIGGPAREIGEITIIIAAYRKWGEECPAKLIGDFAFVIHDRRRRRIFCARDQIGVKPFYYHHAGSAFFFASELRTLLAMPSVPRAVNERRVADYLLSRFDDTASTFHNHILRLPPAHSLTVDADGARPREYWRLDPSRELRPVSDDEFDEQFRAIFTEAVRCRLRGASAGALLSGGLDSSSIVCVAREILRGEGSPPLPTFSAMFDTLPACDERAFIDTVLAGGDLAPHELRADLLSPLDDLDVMLERQCQPFFAPNLFIHWNLYRLAGAAGTNVLLDGFDGDTTISHGVALLEDLARAGRWGKLASEIAALARISGASSSRIIWRRVARPLAPELVKRGWRKLATAARGRGHGSLVDRDLASRVHVDIVDDGGRGPRSAREHHLRRLTSGLIPFTLEVLACSAAAWGVEPRYPFFDRRLVEFCLALPAEQKLRDGWTRMILRRSMGGILPETIRWRRGKSDPGIHFNRCLLSAGPERLESLVTDRSLEGYADMAALREAYRRYTRERDASAALDVWKALTLARWLRRFDGC